MAASNLAKESKSSTDLSQTQEVVEVFIEGRAWRVFIKDLDQFFYCFAEPGGGFLREFHDHLAKHLGKGVEVLCDRRGVAA